MTNKAARVSLILISIPARFIWCYYPNILTCSFFWLFLLTWQCLYLADSKSALQLIGRIPLFIGGICNAVVTVANSGFMPVIDDSMKGTNQIWTQANDSHTLLALCDRFYGFSLGDAILLLAAILIFSEWVSRKSSEEFELQTQNPRRASYL